MINKKPIYTRTPPDPVTDHTLDDTSIVFRHYYVPGKIPPARTIPTGTPHIPATKGVD